MSEFFWLFPLSKLILDKKSCFLGPTNFEILQPNWYYCVYVSGKAKIFKVETKKEKVFNQFFTSRFMETYCRHLAGWTHKIFSSENLQNGRAVLHTLQSICRKWVQNLVCPMLFFCKHLSLVVNKEGQRTMKMAIRMFLALQWF